MRVKHLVAGLPAEIRDTAANLLLLVGNHFAPDVDSGARPDPVDGYRPLALGGPACLC